MTSRTRYGVLTAGAVLALALIVAAFIVAQMNRSTQIAINSRQQFINQGIELSRVNQTLVRALAIAAVRNHDPQLRELLASQGITVTATAPAAPAAAPATTPPAAADPAPAATRTRHKGQHR